MLDPLDQPEIPTLDGFTEDQRQQLYQFVRAVFDERIAARDKTRATSLALDMSAGLAQVEQKLTEMGIPEDESDISRQLMAMARDAILSAADVTDD